MPIGFQAVPRRYSQASGRWYQRLKRELSNHPLHLPAGVGCGVRSRGRGFGRAAQVCSRRAKAMGPRADNPVMSPAACTLVMICAATLPFVLELLARERALRGKDELASRWFAYARRHQLIAAGTVLGWITLMIQLIDQPSPLRAMLSRGHPFGVMAAMVLILAPAAIIPATLGLIAHGVARRLDTTGFTRREMLTRAAWMAVLGVVPAALIGLGTLLLGRMPLAGVALYLLSA